jgi:Ca2+-binding RTX toxin-like protein
VAAVSLSSDNVAGSNAGNTIYGIGSYTRTDGTTAQLADVEFTLASTADPAVDVTAQPLGGAISTGSGKDSIHGGEGVDSIHAGAGDDRVAAADGDDLVFGDAGNDLIDAGTGHDTVCGGLGNDAVAAGLGDGPRRRRR